MRTGLDGVDRTMECKDCGARTLLGGLRRAKLGCHSGRQRGHERTRDIRSHTVPPGYGLP